MRSRSCVLLGLALLAPAAQGETHDYEADTSLDLVRDMLRDPDSARFSDVRRDRYSSVCMCMFHSITFAKRHAGRRPSISSASSGASRTAARERASASVPSFETTVALRGRRAGGTA